MVGRMLPLARAVASAGHTVDVLTLAGSHKSERSESSSLERWGEQLPRVRVSLVGPALRATDTMHPSLVETLARLRKGRAALAEALEQERPDIVVLAKPQLQNAPPTLAFAARTRVPLVLDADDLEAEASRLPALARWHARTLERRAAGAAALITACSPFLVEHFRRLNPAARIELLPTGISIPPSVSPARLRERLGIPTDATIILYVGSLSLSSGHRVDLLINAWSRLSLDQGRNAHLVIAGSGMDEEALRERVARDAALKRRVHFLGRFTPPEDLALAREADLLVDPVDRSRTNEAKSSHRTMLALATGTPIVAGNVGIRPFLLPSSLHELSLYDPYAPDSLTRALARGLEPTVRERFQRETAGCIQQWAWPTLGAQFTRLLETAASTSPSTSSGSG